MDAGVGWVFELVGHKRPRILRDDGVGFFDGPSHTLWTGGEHQLRPQMTQQFLALDTHGLRHGQAKPVTPGRTDKSQRDAGIAAGGLHDQGVRSDQPFFFRIVDHGGADAVLDAAQRVEKFQFGKDLGMKIAAGAIQSDQGCFADGGVNGMVNGHDILLATR